MSETNGDRPAGEHYNAPLRDHEFDGIKEFDNKLPAWWLWTFFGTIVFSVFYWFHYEVFHTGNGSLEAYAIEVKKAEDLQNELAALRVDLTDEGLLKYSKDPKVLESGKRVYLKNCQACHGADGGGTIGPNLTDKFWLHGSKPTQIYKVVNEGVAGKLMQAWGPSLGPVRVAHVTAFLLTLKGTNKKGKAPGPEAKEEG